MKKTKMKKKPALKAFLCIIITIISVLVLAAAAFLISQKIHSSSSTQTLGRTETEYYANSDGSRIENINYSNYLNKDLPKTYTKAKNIFVLSSAQENSKVLQEQIDFLSKNGGGVLYVPEGTYKITRLELKSGVTLFLDRNAVLEAESFDEYENENEIPQSIIYANGQTDIGLSGGGTIDGNGVSFTNEPEEKSPFYALKTFNLYTRVIEARKRIRTAKTPSRPNLVRFENCKNINVDAIRLKDSANWTFVLSKCENTEIKNTVIDNNLHIANADGIDITGATNCTVEHCFIATADDAIVLKPFDREITNVSVSDCTVTSFANCFKIGTETLYDVSDIHVKHCKFFMPSGITGGYSGIAIESSDGSNIKNVTVENIEMDGVSSAFLIWLGNRFKYGKNDIGSIDGVTIKNITAQNIELPSAVTGCKQKNVGGVTIENITCAYRDTEENLSIKNSASEASLSGYPEITRVSHRYIFSHELSKYWSLPSYGLYIRYAEDAKTNDFYCTPRSKLTDSDMPMVTSEKVVINAIQN